MLDTLDEDLLEKDQNDLQESLNEETQSSIQLAEKIYITVNGEVVSLVQKETDYILASIFDYISFDLSKPQGTIQLLRNGASAALTDVLQDGDILEIYWKK